MDPTRWGIASTGKISFDFTAALQMLPSDQHQVAAVGARTLSSAQEFAQKFNIPTSYGSYRELADDSTLGRKVLCEKPLTMNARQARELVALAKERNVFFMEGFWSMFFPVYQRVREELSAGTIGEVGLVQANFGVDESVFVTLHFSNNRVAQFSSSIRLNLSQGARIVGSKGRLEIPLFWAPVEVVTPEKTYNYALPKPTVQMNYFRSEGFIYEAEAVRQSLLKGEKENPLMTHQDSVRIMDILDEIRRQVKYVCDADKE